MDQFKHYLFTYNTNLTAKNCCKDESNENVGVQKNVFLISRTIHSGIDFSPPHQYATIQNLTGG